MKKIMYFQYKKEIDSKKQIQTDIQKIKKFTESIYSWFNQREGRALDLENRVTVNDHAKKRFLKIARNQEKLIKQLKDEPKKNNLWLIRVNEKAGDNTNIIRNMFKRVIAENFQT